VTVTEDLMETTTFTVDAITDRSVVENAAFTGPTPTTSGDAPIGSLTWTLEGADDAGDFTVDGMTGVVSMVARDHEDPQDTGGNNVYEVTLRATDDGREHGRRVVHGDGDRRDRSGQLHHRRRRPSRSTRSRTGAWFRSRT
jgi:hypothetical protein